MNENRTVLILGATGGIGRELSRRLLARGWQVKALTRAPERLDLDDARSGVKWLKGDALSRTDVCAAADGASVIVHAVNPPGYRNWSELVLPMLDNTITAAVANRAHIVLPGTVYNFGPDALPAPDEDSPQHPVTVKGRIRAEMERRLHAASRAGAKALILRAGDFFGPGAQNNWFSMGLVKPGKAVSKITYPGASGVGHQWAYLPDVAETMVRLIELRDALGPFASFHMAGHWDPDGTEMIASIRRAVGKPDLKVARMPWRLMALLSPFVPLFRELSEMRYLWQMPVRMRNDRLRAVLGDEPHTPLDAAVKTTLIGLGCLPPAAGARAVSA